MPRIEDIEREIAGLSPDEMVRFRIWYDEFDAGLWDKQFEDDAKSGRLDAVAEKAMEDYTMRFAGRCAVGKRQ